MLLIPIIDIVYGTTYTKLSAIPPITLKEMWNSASALFGQLNAEYVYTEEQAKAVAEQARYIFTSGKTYEFLVVTRAICYYFLLCLCY